MRFEIVNTGTNIAAGGWTFNAQLPINGLPGQGGYTFASQPQRALYPGDKIVYTLGYDNPYQNGYAGGCSYNCGTPYNNGGYGYTGQSSYTAPGGYTCNGYGPCNVPNSYPSTIYQNGGVVTIIADPYNYLIELTKQNNTATYPVGY